MKKNKELGMLLGLHCGDSLGATLEFRESRSESNLLKDIVGGVFGWNAGDSTDDTDLALLVLKSIENRTNFNINKLLNNMINWRKSEPVDIGGTILQAMDYQEQRKLNFRTMIPDVMKSSKSNGSLMRVAPMALLDSIDLEYLITSQCNITHFEPDVINADILFVKCLKMAISGKTKEDIISIFTIKITRIVYIIRI